MGSYILDRWLLLVDLDGTLWDHLNISELTPPFKRVNKHVITDQKGVRVHLKLDMVKLIRWARNNNALVSTLSWNYMDKAIEDLKTFQLLDLFDFHAIEYHPNKHLMLKRLLKMISERLGITFDLCRIVYIDDRTIHLEKIYSYIGKIIFLQAWRDFRNIIFPI
jgi:magnesium-dependent phosphatase-1